MNKEAGSVKKRRSPGAARRLTLKRSGAASSLCGNLSRQSRAMPGPRRSEADSCRLDLENSEALGPGGRGKVLSPPFPSGDPRGLCRRLPSSSMRKRPSAQTLHTKRSSQLVAMRTVFAVQAAVEAAVFEMPEKA